MTTEQQFLLQNSVGVFAWRSDDLGAGVEYLGETDSSFDTLTQSLGDREALYSADTARRGKTRVVGYTEGAEALPEFTINWRLDADGANWIMERKRERCNLDFFLAFAKCGRPDQYADWTYGILIEDVRATNIEFGALQSREESSADVLLTSTFKGIQFDQVNLVELGDVAGSVVLEEVIDGVIIDAASCGDCAPYQAPCSTYFAVTKEDADSPGLPAQVIWKKGDASWNTTDLTGITIGNDPTAIIDAGAYIAVFSATEESHFYARQDEFLNSGFTGSWTEVTGYTASAGATCAWFKNSREIFVGGLGGYIYKLTDVTQAPTVLEDGTVATDDINAIHGFGNTIVAVTDGNKLKVSTNGGDTWRSIDGNSAAAGRDLTAIAVKDQYNWLFGDSTGDIWQTRDQGDTVEVNNQDASLTYIRDIQISPDSDEIVYVAADNASGGIILRSLAGGRAGTWYQNVPFVRNLTTAPTRYNFVSACGYNRILVGGTGATATDGVLALGTD